MNSLPEGLIIVCKRDCPTCALIEPVYHELASGKTPLTIFTQDDPAFPCGMDCVVADTSLEHSYRLKIETVPTLIRADNGRERERLVGWRKEEWQVFTGIASLGESLPDYRPGCGSMSVEPGIADELALRFGDTEMNARRIRVSAMEDEMEACFDRGWSDGLPVVPPTEIRVYRMLQGTKRAPDKVVGVIPPNRIPCTVEKVAINAVLAGCKPEYMPVVLSAVEAACMEEFCMHGLLCTTYFSGPVVIVSGPIAKAIGMNSGINALGQGNRANATIGRALQLIIRNVGGGRPGKIDRAALGNPGKYTFCFSENLEGSSWDSLSKERGFESEASTVTLFAGDGTQGVADQLSRQPESLILSLAHSLRTVVNYKLAMSGDAFLIISPEHSRVFELAGWCKAKVKDEINQLLRLPGSEMIRGAGGNSEGMPERFADQVIPKFRPGGLNIVRAGGKAGLFSAIIAGWVASGPTGSIPVTREIII